MIELFICLTTFDYTYESYLDETELFKDQLRAIPLTRQKFDSSKIYEKCRKKSITKKNCDGR